MKKVVFTNEQIKDIINEYVNNHISMQNISIKYNVSREVISRVLKENNIGTDTNNHHKYYADYRKFQFIDSPEKAYWLGFIAADGCVYVRDKNASVIISIHQKDSEHLEKFKQFMNSNVKILYYIQNCGFSNNTPMCKITFNSKEMAQDFIDKGVPPRKSLILKPPIIDKQYYLPYILGYFDGDGSIFKANNEFGINFVGTKEMLNWINQTLGMEAKLEQKKGTPKDKNNYSIRCGGTNKPYIILKQLYDNCNTHLDRKYELFKTLETVVLNRNIK